MNRRPTMEVIARNLEALVLQSGIEWQTLAIKSGVSLRTINYIRHCRDTKVETIDKIAAVFGLLGWHLLNPNLMSDIKNQEWIDRISQIFREAPQEGRELLKKAAEAVEYMPKGSLKPV